MSAFRHLDVDKLDPDSVVNQTPEIEPSGISVQDIEAIVASARASLQGGNVEQALKGLLEFPPYGSSEETKAAATTAVVQTLSSARSADIASIVANLDSQERVVLIKFLYRAFGTQQGQSNGGILLQWHEKVVQAAGQGIIVKHLTDRRTI